MNLRYAAFVKAHGKQPFWVFHHFISAMKEMYAKSLGENNTPMNPLIISDHDYFTAFIEKNASDFDAECPYTQFKTEGS